MNGFSHDLMIRGIAAVKAHELKEARYCFERLLDLDAPDEERMEAWYWLSEISDDFKEKRNYLDEILSRNLGDVRARRALAILNGEIEKGRIIDSNEYQPPLQGIPAEVDKKRFTCPNCGGRMTYTPDGNSLTCEYCERNEKLGKHAGMADNPAENNFIAAMATAMGQSKPVLMRSITCDGCGRSFVLSADSMTFECPSCKTLYEVDQVKLAELIEPQRIIPFTVTSEQALDLLNKHHRPGAYHITGSGGGLHGIYIPVWLFSVGGVVDWTYQVYKDRKKISLFRQEERTIETIPGSSVILYENITVPAVEGQPGQLKPVIDDFDLESLVPYDIRYLSNWIGQAYQVSLADASLEARSQVLEQEKKRIERSVPMNARNLVVHSSGIVVESYQLIVVPIWVAYQQEDHKQISIMINGQSGKIFGPD